MSGHRARRPGLLPVLWALCGVGLSLLPACLSGPPAWVAQPPESAGWWYASGACGDVSVDADARQVALTRAARTLAERLGLDVEGRLSVVLADDRLWVEALGARGLVTELSELELVRQAERNGITYVLVRLPRS
ncbi:MAG: hypothetical protein ACT4PU_10395 [Planctomycetota bacterium]